MKRTHMLANTSTEERNVSSIRPLKMNFGRIKNAVILFMLFFFIACSHNYKGTQVDSWPDIYPDYTNIDIPYTIAPLNFKMKEGGRLYVEFASHKSKFEVSGKDKINIPYKKFKNLLSESIGDTIWVSVSRLGKNGWLTFKSFYWKVAPEPIDSFLTYRLIEPGYEVWNKISLAQRNITGFDETYIADNNLAEGSCMNCHIVNKHKPEQSFFHIRGPKGMTIIAEGKKLRSVNTKPKGAYANMIYGNWHPTGRFIAFSTNVVLPSIHSYHDKRAFVYDTISDVVVLDIRKNEILRSPLLSKADIWETFPEFSADGKKLYFCTARKVKLPGEYLKLQYSLCSVDFDPVKRTFGEKVDTLFNGPANRKTVSESKASPDGKYIMFTCFSYGTFPIWHADARLYTYDLTSGKVDSLPQLNNNKNYSNSYHSWSANGRWVVFASKRDNGLYGKPYFSYIDKDGKAHKPFVLPQKDAEFYDYYLKSFNVPELSQKAVSFDALDIQKIFEKSIPDTLRYAD